MYADLWDKGIDLDGLWSGSEPVHRAIMVGGQLPPGSRVHHATTSDSAWNTNDYLLANVIDAVQDLTWVTSNRKVPRANQSPRPKPVSRPADLRKQEATTERMADEGRRFKDFEARRARGEVQWPTAESAPVHRGGVDLKRHEEVT